MAARTPRVSLIDIENAIWRIERYTKGKSQAEFEKDEMVRDAVARSSPRPAVEFRGT